MPIKINGQTTGSVTLAAQATGSDVTLTLPSSSTASVATSETAFMLTGSLSPSNRNILINGDFSIWQRGTSLSGQGYLADRWICVNTTSASRSTDTPNYQFPYSIEFVSNSATFPWVGQRIESNDSRKLVGKSATLSFWAKNISGTSNLYVEAYYANAVDNFSSTTSIIGIVLATNGNVSSSWTKYSVTFSNLPAAIANGLQIMIIRNNDSAATTRLTGIQLEEGSIATAFETENIGDTLRKCQRYYFRTPLGGLYRSFGMGYANSTTSAVIIINQPTTMRIPPSSVERSGTIQLYGGSNSVNITNLQLGVLDATANSCVVNAVATGLVTDRPYTLCSNNDSTAYVALNAEL